MVMMTMTTKRSRRKRRQGSPPSSGCFKADVLAAAIASWLWLAHRHSSLSLAEAFSVRSRGVRCDLGVRRHRFSAAAAATTTAATTARSAAAVPRAPSPTGGGGGGKSRGHRSAERDRGPRSRQRQDGRQRPYGDMTADELHGVTLHHLSRSIRPAAARGDGAPDGALGTMPPAQLHEFARLLAAWSKRAASAAGREDRLRAAEMAEQCLHEIADEARAGNAGAVRVLVGDLYYLVIRAWRQVGGHRELVHATGLLDLMERNAAMASGDPGDSNNNSSKTFDSFNCYVAVLDGWCKSRAKGAERKAEDLLHRLAAMVRAGGRRQDGVALVKQYNNVMNRIAAGRAPAAGREAERLLMEMIAAHRHGDRDGDGNGNGDDDPIVAPPDRSSFNIVIKAYANGGGRRAAANARRILAMMEDPAATLGTGGAAAQISPDKFTYTSVLTAMANAERDGRRQGGRRDGRHHESRGDGGDSDHSRAAGNQAEALLANMHHWGITPDVATYNAVMKVWGTCSHPNAGERSEILLYKMIQLYEESGDSNIIPDHITFNTVIHNIANSNTSDSPKRAMRLLERMDDMYKSGMINAKPDIISYNSVLNAFAKSGGPESARHAEEMLKELEQTALHHDNVSPRSTPSSSIRPDVYSYNIVISAWGNCGYANKAVALLDRMTALSNDRRADLKPDATTYNTVLNAWSQSSDRNAPVKALGLLELMLRLHEGGDQSAKPDALSFTTVINAFSKSRFPRKAQQAWDILRRMKLLYEEEGQREMRPNVFVYSAVLNACAYTFGRAEEKEEALKVGIKTYEELQSSDIKANHVAYGSFVRVCRKLMPEGERRNHFISKAFEQCCSDGQLGEYVLRQLRAVPELYYLLLEEYILDDTGELLYQDLPFSWTYNVKDRKRRKSVRGQFGKGLNDY